MYCKPLSSSLGAIGAIFLWGGGVPQLQFRQLLGRSQAPVDSGNTPTNPSTRYAMALPRGHRGVGIASEASCTGNRPVGLTHSLTHSLKFYIRLRPGLGIGWVSRACVTLVAAHLAGLPCGKNVLLLQCRTATTIHATRAACC